MKLQTIIKFIILVAIFYALLAFNIFHLGEKIVPSIKDYLQTNIQIEDKDIEETYFSTTDDSKDIEHFAARNRYEVMLETICNKINICDKVYFSGDYTLYEKYSYTKAIATLVDFIDKN
jgi:hypothetical protein